MKILPLFLNISKGQGEKTLLWSLAIGAAFIAFTPEVLAVQAGEMNQSVTNLRALLGGNVMAAVLTAGCVAGAVFAYMQNSLKPLGIAIGAAIAYAFANTWINTAYTICA